MKKQQYILLFLFGIFLFPQANYAQVDFNKKPDDDLGDVTDAYQEHFFEALKQKGIENYDRAVEALLKCVAISEKEPALFYELGKNYNKLKNYTEAENVLLIAVEKEPDNEWFLDELYDVYAKQNDIENALKTVKQLIKYHPDYKEDLATLYVKTKQYNEALQILDELDAEYGVSNTRDRVRNLIYKATGRKKEQIKNLEERIDVNPNEERNYLSLIYRYSENNQKEKAFQTAQILLKKQPKSQLVHLALYKFYLDKNQADLAINSMQIVLNSNQIKPDAKALVLNDFVKFVSKNPEYESQLVELTANLGLDDSTSTNIEVAQYFLAKGNKAKALSYYEKALVDQPESFPLIRNVLLLYIDVENYTLAVQKSEEVLDKFPSQPLLYLINGVAQNKLNQAQKAIRVLETGLDYIIDDNKMESDFYKQLSVSYTQLNNTSKAKAFSDKAKQLYPSN
ncbi:MAG: tetratricopeptide repeat protein [Oceanihabitans sp.]